MASYKEVSRCTWMKSRSNKMDVDMLKKLITKFCSPKFFVWWVTHWNILFTCRIDIFKWFYTSPRVKRKFVNIVLIHKINNINVSRRFFLQMEQMVRYVSLFKNKQWAKVSFRAVGWCQHCFCRAHMGMLKVHVLII